jgi:NitT/TauT family transport system substrate-binding protein
LRINVDARIAAEPIKIGLIKTTQNAPFYIAIARGYFEAEGLEAKPAYFDAAQPIAVAVAGGTIDFGMVGVSAGLYSLAGQGALRFIAGQSREVPGFPNNTIIASNAAYMAGMRSIKDISGHSVAVATVGGPPHLVVALVAERAGIDTTTMRFLPLQTLSNMVSAVVGGQADLSTVPASTAIPLIQAGKVQLLAYAADSLRLQLGVVFVSARTADGKRDIVQHFLRAYRKASGDYHDAIADANDKPREGPMLPEIVRIVSGYTGETPDQVKMSLGFADAEARLDAKNISDQITWYKAHNFLKSDASYNAIIDTRYAVPLPEK